MRELLRPPRGRDIRRLMAFMALVIGVPRLDVFGTFAPRFLTGNFIPAQVSGVLLTVLAIGLLATLNKRLTWYGRLIAVFLCSLHATMGVDALSASITSALIEFLIAYALLGEIVANE